MNVSNKFSDSNISEYLCCPKCKSDLINQDDFLVCIKCKEKYEIIDDNIIKIFNDITPDIKLSIQKWDKIYQEQIKSGTYIKAKEDYLRDYYGDIFKQTNECKKIDKDLVYLEIGCGKMFFGQEIADKCKLVIGIDFCPSALKIAKKMLDEKGYKNYLLIQGDILNMSIKSEKIDLIYGGGVIEHFKNTQKCINELYRVLRKDGVSFNTVPYLNLGSLTYRQIWGNIPNMPILKQIAEFIHIKLLRGKHMVFGYELSFLSSTLMKLHKKSGFKKVFVDKFKIKLAFDFISTKLLKDVCIWLANNNRLFWPMIKIIGKK